MAKRGGNNAVTMNVHCQLFFRANISRMGVRR